MLPNANTYWITKTEYDEEGESIINRRLDNHPNFI